MSPLHHHHLRIPLLALPTIGFFPVSLHQFTPFINAFTQALPTSNVTPTPTPPSDPPPRDTHPRIFSRLSTSIYAIFKCFYSDTPYLQRHPYTIPQCPPCAKRTEHSCTNTTGASFAERRCSPAYRAAQRRSAVLTRP